MERTRAHRGFGFAVAFAVVALGIGGSPGPAMSASAPVGAQVLAPRPVASPSVWVREASPVLVNAKQWVWQGTKLPDGACQYRYPTRDRVAIPESGWVIRSIEIDMSNCTKLMEEGAPAAPISLAQLIDPAGGTAQSQALPTMSKSGSVPGVLAPTSTRGAWQMVSWLDFISLPTTRDLTQIRWTYNGSSVLSGNATGWWWHNNLGWTLTFNEVTQKFEAGAFRGQTKATFRNQLFCGQQQPTVYTYYYHNRVWGHANGTATIAQSSDTFNDCLPLHVDITSGYN